MTVTHVPWTIGPNETECLVEVELHQGECTGYPWVTAEGGIGDAVVIEGGKRRGPTDAEWKEIERDEDAIFRLALGLQEGPEAW